MCVVLSVVLSVVFSLVRSVVSSVVPSVVNKIKLIKRAQDTSKKAFETGIDVIRLAGACGVDLGDEAR